MSQRFYLEHEATYPASARLNSIPPRHYDVYDEDGELIDSDVIYRTRSRSLARERASLRDGWVHPCYRDLIEAGRGVSPGHHYFPRSSTEFSREILSNRAQSPASIPETFNRINSEFTEHVRERLHKSKHTALYPETYRARSSSYNPVLGRYMRTPDSPGYRYYRFGSDYNDFPPSMRSRPSRYSSRQKDIIFAPNCSSFAKF